MARLTADLDLAFDSDALSALRKQVHVQAGRAGVHDGRIGDVVLTVHELAANAIRHGRGAGRLRIWDLTGALRCQVDDGDPPLPGDSAAVRSLPDLPGHGLWVVRQLADQVQIAAGPHGTRVTVTFNA